MYLLDKNPKGLIGPFMKVLARKTGAINAYVLKRHPFPSDIQMLLGDLKKSWKKWANHVPVIEFSNGKYDLDMVKKYLVKRN